MTAPPSDRDPTSAPSNDDPVDAGLDDADLDTLRDAFVEAYNARDLEALLDLVDDDVETPDLSGDGPDALADEIRALWERSPAAVLTTATSDGSPAAVAWLPDEAARWIRAALFTFDGDAGLLTVVGLPDDGAALEEALTDGPGGDALDEEQDWAEWDRGEDSGDAGWGWDESQLRG